VKVHDFGISFIDAPASAPLVVDDAIFCARLNCALWRGLLLLLMLILRVRGLLRDKMRLRSIKDAQEQGNALVRI
jgi:hypothetical protein